MFSRHNKFRVFVRAWPILSRLSTRNYSNDTRHSLSVQFSAHGDPVKVLGLKETVLPSPGNDEVLVRMLAAPVNPADINIVQGVYPIRPELPAVGGSEGVGKVVEIGKDVEGFSIGDWVIPAIAGIGTWRTAMIQKAANLMVIPNDLPIVNAATFAVNPCTAFRMLTDFVKLEHGDVVIQNGANSGVGQSIIQIAAAMGISTVNVIREKPDEGDGVMEKNLMDYGATHVITDSFVKQPEMKTLMKSLPKPKLALNCVGGKNAAELLKYLDRGGVMVTYGGMSRMPMLVPAGPLIFNDIRLVGYWMTQWNRDHHNKPERADMIEKVTAMIRDGKLNPPPHKEFPIAQYKEAVFRSMQPYHRKKNIMIMDKV